MKLINNSQIPDSLVNAVFTQLASSDPWDLLSNAAYYGINNYNGFIFQEDTTSFYDSNTSDIIKLASQKAKELDESTEEYLNRFSPITFPIEHLLLHPKPAFKANLSWLAGDEVALAILEGFITNTI